MILVRAEQLKADGPRPGRRQGKPPAPLACASRTASLTRAPRRAGTVSSTRTSGMPAGPIWPALDCGVSPYPRHDRRRPARPRGRLHGPAPGLRPAGTQPRAAASSSPGRRTTRGPVETDTAPVARRPHPRGERRRGTAAARPGKFLALSGGGMYGAYAVGVLSGWTATGTRPVFDVVTGVSTGALIATYAFLGPEYDRPMVGCTPRSPTATSTAGGPPGGPVLRLGRLLGPAQAADRRRRWTTPSSRPWPRPTPPAGGCTSAPPTSTPAGW